MSAGTSLPGDETASDSSIGPCGDGNVGGSEECDGSDLAGQDCISLGLGPGRLACSADCIFDVSGCTSSCGDGVIDDGEECDGDALGGADCSSVNQDYIAGTLSCGGDCTFDTSLCSEYDGDCCAREDTPGCENPACSEAVCAENSSCCDQFWDDLCVEAALAEVACQGVGGSCPELGDCCLSNVSPGCESAECTMAICDLRPSCCDESWSSVCAQAAISRPACQGAGGSCPNSLCGDGFTSVDEVCDGLDLNGQTCMSYAGRDGGVLRCLDDCSGFDDAACADYAGDCCSAHAGPGCDDLKCTNEICDEDSYCCEVIWDSSCESAAIVEPACYGVGACPEAQLCGEGDGENVAQFGEICDGTDLNGQDCFSQGFSGGGVLACDQLCQDFDDSMCYSGDCCSMEEIPEGNGSPGCNDEECTLAVCADGNDHCCNVAWDGSCAARAATLAACSGVSNCEDLCGNGALDDSEGEVCDGDQLGVATCASLGYGTGGGDVLACLLDCSGFDTSGCVANYSGSCCMPNGTPGCGSPGCTEHVCGLNSGCCDLAWGNDCAFAATSAPLFCDGVDPSCDPMACGNNQTQVGEVCDGEDLTGESCITQGYGGGDLACQANCMNFDDSACWDGDCCEDNLSAGCGVPVCANSVCSFDPFCCESAWDSICADEARADANCQDVDESCPSPLCGDGFAEGSEICDGADLSGQDCVSQGYGGGTLLCAGCTGFNVSGCYTGDCCAANETPGCIDSACVDAICAMGEMGSECCDVEWTANCAATAAMEPACQGAGGSCPF